MAKPKTGDRVEYVNEVGVSQEALVTIYWGGEQEDGPLNLVVVSLDKNKTDSYGQQIEHYSSVCHESKAMGVHGRFWR